MGGYLNARKLTWNILGLYYSHEYVKTKETWTHENQPNIF